MDDILFFKSNWNHKLDCDYFTTIRLRNDKKYFVGRSVKVVLREGSRTIEKGSHTIVGIRNLLLSEIDDYTARLDTGYSAKECQDLIKAFYKNSAPQINWKYQQLSIILVKKEAVKTPTLF